MSEKLGVTRAAVAKHVGALRRHGHIIASCTNRGYLLQMRHEPVSLDAVRPFLTTTIIGKACWRIFSETSSTNTEAITWALSDAKEGSVVAAERQTEGKGRKRMDWFSSPRGLQFSVILRPNNERIDEGSVMRAALEAAIDAIETETGITPTHKPPNDLFLNKRKIAGVLIESGKRAGEPDWLVMGMGCNVNIPHEEFPEEIRQKVTSLYAESGMPYSMNRLLAQILNVFEQKLLRIRND